jgi:hypothetical protein
VTDALDQTLAHVVLNLLATDAALKVFDGEVPSNPTPIPPYVVVYTTMGHPANDQDNSLDGLSRVRTARWYLHCIGRTPEAARAVAQRVRSVLLDVRPVVAGMQCGMLREQTDPPAPTRDESTGDAVFDALVIYEVRASI